jgi:photosystem II stability/assembly factor-like uncharacterized protein
VSAGGGDGVSNHSYAVGEGGAVLEGGPNGAWRSIHDDVGAGSINLNAVSNSLVGSIIIVGDAGAIFTLTNRIGQEGGTWQSYTMPGGPSLHAAFVVVDAYVLGAGVASLLQLSSTGAVINASPYDLAGGAPMLTGLDVPQVSTGNDDAIFVTGGDGLIYRNNPPDHTAILRGAAPVAGAGPLNAISSCGLTERVFYVVGDGGAIYRGDGTTWQQEPSGTSQPLYSVICLTDTWAFAVGAGGTILQRTTAGWAAEDSHTQADLRGINQWSSWWLIAVGAQGTILTRPLR